MFELGTKIEAFAKRERLPIGSCPSRAINCKREIYPR